AARVAGAQVVLIGGEAVLYVERGGRSLVPLRDPDESWLVPALRALVAYVRGGGAKRLAVERFDGEPVTESEVMPLLVEAGFLAEERLRAVPRGEQCVRIRYGSRDHELARLDADDSLIARLEQREETILDTLVGECRRAVSEDGAEAILLGCTCMAGIAPAIE